MSEINNISLDQRTFEEDFLVDLKNKKKEIVINSKFLLIIGVLDSHEEEINVYDLKSLSFFGSIKHDKVSGFVNFHKDLESIFFTCNAKNIFVYQIDIQTKSIKELSIIKGHFTKVKFADFSPFNPDVLVSVSESYDIKIYDIKKSLPISHIFLNESLDDGIHLKWNEKYMGIISGKKIIIFNYLLFVPEDVKNILFDEKVIDFHFYEKKNFFINSINEK